MKVFSTTVALNKKILSLQKELKHSAGPQRAKILARFFKTGKGEYGEGDRFLGITVPVIRKISHKFSDLSLLEVEKLLKSKIHEERLAALLILVYQFENGSQDQKKKVYEFYLDHTTFINNWDLVDLSAHKIIGKFLQDKDRSILYKLAKSRNLWERRIAIIATFQFIKNNQLEETLKISQILLGDSHDLIQKAVGWMMREVGKRDLTTLEEFLKKHYQKIPRVTLRYAIERLPEQKRKQYLAGFGVMIMSRKSKLR